MFAQVLVEYNVKTLDKTFTYKIADNIKDKLKVGMKVKVPFNKSYINGFVIKIIENKTYDNLKEVNQIVDECLVLNEELLAMGKYLKSKTLCSLISAYQTMLPSSLKIKNQKSNYQKYAIYIKLNEDVDINEYIKNNKYPSQIKILKLLQEKKEVLKKEITSSSLKTLLNKNIVLENKVKINRLNIKEEIVKDNDLTLEQEKVFLKIKENLNKEKTFLLHGITGSGKTEVYIHIIKEVIKLEQKALLLVPEITLSAQIVKRFYERFGSKVAIFHSALSEGERYDEYKKIMNNEVDVVVGTRSAIFTPVNNLGIIIIDEEHSDNYKQENNPRYNTLDMALFRSKYNKCPLLLGSATPSLESMARAKKGIYQLLTLNSRVNNAVLPKVLVVNMQDEMKKRNLIFSDELKNKIQKRLDSHEQIILLLNRRGHSTIITCQNCGFTYKCPHCEISLTYHKSSNNLRCHYCGYTIFKPNKCPECNEEALNYYGLGTEKLEGQIKEEFKNARVIRMDVDTTSKKGSQDKIITAFLNEEYDILLGTQMISKGLDFPKVTLVGVINADTSLNMPDFKATERTFSLLMQTAGRAGRSGANGEVVIQTFNPEHEIFECLKNHDYERFFKYEMQNRHDLDYPPYYFLTSIKIASKNYEEASKEANKVASFLRKKINAKSICLGPTPASMFKINNIYRFQIIVKYKFDDSLSKALIELDQMYILNKNVNLEIDLSPNIV